MKTILIILIFFPTLFYSQIIKDSVLGKPKYVKEFVVFLNDSGPYTFMRGDNEYGHATIMKPNNLRLSMSGSWFETDFCRYINNETYYDKHRNIIKETWYYKSGRIVDDYDYGYDALNRLIDKKSKNESSEKKSHYFYDGNKDTPKFIETHYRWKNESPEKYLVNLESFKPLLVTKFDTLSKTDSVYVITNEIWKEAGERSYTKSQDSVYYKKLSRVKTYDDQYRVIEEKFFNYENDYQNKKIYLTKHLKYEYDAYGNLINKTDFDDGKIYYYTMLGSGKFVKEIKDDGTPRISNTIYTYTKDRKLKSRTNYYNNKPWNDIKFEYRDNYITKVLYLDKFDKEDKKVEPKIIIFKYTFDKQKNWTEIIKNVDGKDLYKWVRKIEYY